MFSSGVTVVGSCGSLVGTKGSTTGPTNGGTCNLIPCSASPRVNCCWSGRRWHLRPLLRRRRRRPLSTCKPPHQDGGCQESEQHANRHRATRSGLDGLLGHGGAFPQDAFGGV